MVYGPLAKAHAKKIVANMGHVLGESASLDDGEPMEDSAGDL